MSRDVLELLEFQAADLEKVLPIFAVVDQQVYL